MTVGAHIRVTESGVDELASGFSRVDKNVNKLSKSSRRLGSDMSRGLGKATGKIRGLYAAIGGVSLLAAGKKVLDFDDALGLLQAKTKMTTDEMQGMKTQILDVTKAYGLQKEEVLAAIQTYQDFGGYVKQGRATLMQFGKVAKATGADMGDLAKLQTIFIEQGMGTDDHVKALAALNAQADAGKVALAGLARVYPRIAEYAAGMGFSGIRGVEQIGTAFQVAGQVSAGPEEAATQLQALLRDLSHSAGKLKSIGVNVYEGKGKNKRTRDLDAIMGDLAKKTGGKTDVLMKYFKESIKTATTWVGQSLKSGGGKPGEVMRAGRTASVSTLDRALALRLGGIAANSEKVKTGFAYLDSALQTYGGKFISYAAENPWKVAAGAAGAYGAMKLGPKLLSFIFGGGRGGGAAGVAGALGNKGGVTPVFVVNMPGANLFQAAGYGLGPGGKGGPAGKVGKLGKLGKLGGALGRLGGAAMIGYGLGKATEFGLEMLADYQREQGAERAKKHATRLGKASAIDHAKRLAKLAKGGLKSVEKQGGGRMALTRENIVQHALNKAGSAGDEKLRAALEKLTSAILGNPATVTVVPKGGLDKPSVQTGRGKL